MKKILVILTAVLFTVCGFEAQAARVAKVKAEIQQEDNPDIEASRLVGKAKELLAAQESERGVKMLESIIDQYPKSRVRYQACLELGKYLVGAQKYNDAIKYLRFLNELNKPDTELNGENKDWYLEAQYLMGVAYFHMRQYGSSFERLRSITHDYPNTVWANQSYYYIGMCHFAQQNWNKAIEALGMVGTFVDPDSPAIEWVEAGRRFYVKIVDDDIPILTQTGGEITVQLENKNGDRETITCVPVGGKEAMAIGSIPTAVGVAVTNDHVLQVIGGDVITVKYYDDNTSEGKKNVRRESKVKVVANATLDFVTGIYETKALAAFLGQPVFILVNDLDQDISDQADKINVRVVSRYKSESDESTARAASADKIYLKDDDKNYEIRDEVNLLITELGTPPVHSGRFGGLLQITAIVEGTPVDRSDQVLSCALNDEIVAFYTDEVNMAGARLELIAKIKVVGEIDGRPMATQNIVLDPVVKARKELVEATAFLELTRIFRSMGLMKNAVEKSKEGLDRVQDVILMKSAIPSGLREEAFKLKWNIQIEVGDYNNAIATCRLFSQMFPTSRFTDEALLKVGAARMESGDLSGAIQIFNSILSMPNSQAKAEAQFRIGEARTMQAAKSAESSQNKFATNSQMQEAMKDFKLCAEKYPDSEFAGKSLGKLVDYYIETKDYAQADYLLEQIFQDYPDADFLDSMLLKWVIASYRTGNSEKAREKCNQLLFEYPASQFVTQAKTILPKLERKIKE